MGWRRSPSCLKKQGLGVKALGFRVKALGFRVYGEVPVACCSSTLRVHVPNNWVIVIIIQLWGKYMILGPLGVGLWGGLKMLGLFRLGE